MKPTRRNVLGSSNYFQEINAGPVVAKIQGSIKKLGDQYQNADVVLYNKANLQPIAIKKPDQNGNYQFLGLNTDLRVFIVAFDQKEEYNAAIQDRVIAK